MSKAAPPSAIDEADSDLESLGEIARRIRVNVIRAVHNAKAGHIGGSFSSAEIFSVLYFHEMSVRPEDPFWPERDRFVLSKGHCSIGLYSTLALRGYFPLAELETFDSLGSRLQGHPDETRLPGLDASSGSLGVGVSAAIGLAIGAKLKGWPSRVYALLGDGECQEGEVWEAAFLARRYELDNLVVIVDANRLGQYGPAAPTPGNRLAPWVEGELEARWRACRWNVIEVDGHDIGQIAGAFGAARKATAVPTAIIAHTTKGKGVSFMEDRWGWHTKVPTDDEFRRAMIELGEKQ